MIFGRFKSHPLKHEWCREALRGGLEAQKLKDRREDRSEASASKAVQSSAPVW